MTNSDHSLSLEALSPRWHRIYYVLAAFDVFTVALSLWLNYLVVTKFTASIADNARWEPALAKTWEVARTSLDIVEFTNDSFETRDAAANMDQLHVASKTFDEELEAMRTMLRQLPASAETGVLYDNLRGAATSKTEMLKQSERLIGRLAEKQYDDAQKHLVAVSRVNAHIISIMKQVRDTIHVIQQEELRQQGESAIWLQRFAGIVTLLMIVMVVGATYWGFRLARRAAEEVRQDRISKRELEQRVELRTQELQQAFRRHEDLIKQLITAQEDERARIARDLHDEIGQTIASLMLGLRALDDATEIEQVRANLGSLRRQTVQAAEEIRRLARGFRPAALDDLGLPAAVERLASDVHQTHGIEVAWNVHGEQNPRLPKVIETALYRIIQEAINNVVKHAHASQIWIDLDRMPDKVNVQIADDGRGITPEILIQAHQNGRMGVTGMRERATLLGGSVQFIRRRAGGTSVQVVIPLTSPITGN